MIFGTYRAFVSEEDIWSFSPFVDLSIYRWIRRNLMRPRLDRQIILLMLILGDAGDAQLDFASVSAPIVRAAYG